MKRLHLEVICNIANKYMLKPTTVTKIYNNAIQKQYIEDKWEALNLTERVVQRYYPIRTKYGKWKVIEYHEFEWNRGK
jgi:hypothetical protein